MPLSEGISESLRVYKNALQRNLQTNSSTSLSVQFSHSVVSNSLQSQRLQHSRPPFPSPTPRAYSNSCPLSWWCHPTISSSVVPLSSCLQSFLASGSFQESQFSTAGDQSIGVSSSTSVLPMNIQDWFLFGWTGCISLQSKGLSRVFSNTTVQKHPFFSTQLSLVELLHPYMITGKTIALTRWTFVGKIMSLLFNMLSRLVITFLPGSKRLLISCCSHHLQWLLFRNGQIPCLPRSQVSQDRENSRQLGQGLAA